MNNVVFVDTSDLYFTCKKRFGVIPDYIKYLEACRADKAFAYGFNGNEFENVLVKAGYVTRFYELPHNLSKARLGVAISVDALRHSDGAEWVILGSSSPELVPLVVALREQGFKVQIFACGISADLAKVADSTFEITEDLLYRGARNELSTASI